MDAFSWIVPGAIALYLCTDFFSADNLFPSLKRPAAALEALTGALLLASCYAYADQVIRDGNALSRVLPIFLLALMVFGAVLLARGLRLTRCANPHFPNMDEQRQQRLFYPWLFTWVGIAGGLHWMATAFAYCWLMIGCAATAGVICLLPTLKIESH